MLKDLKILNGRMTLEFDSQNYIYTVFVSNLVDSLELDYKLEPNNFISIMGNDYLVEGLNEVVISVYNEEQVNSYYLYVYKENSSLVSNTLNNYDTLNITSKELPSYVLPSIASICFIIIILLFSIIFRKNN